MKNKLFIESSVCLWFTILLFVFGTSCIRSANSQERIETTAEAPTATRFTVVTNQPTVTVDLTPTEANTPLSSLATPLPTETSFPILTTIPTLSVEQSSMLEARERLLQELMEMNGNCQLPCWWGVELGESLKNAEEKFMNRGISLGFTPSNFNNNDEQGYVHLGYYNSLTRGDDVSITANFQAVDGNIQFIDVLAERPLRQYGEEELVRDWEKHTLNSMLQQYGKPPYVYLVSQNVADPGPPNFVLILYYPNLGFKFSYQPHNISSNESQAEFCLNLESMRQINLSLYNPEFVDLWTEYLLPPALNPEAPDYFEKLTWEAQTGMNLDMFYEIYKASNSPKCIKIIQ